MLRTSTTTRRGLGFGLGFGLGLAHIAHEHAYEARVAVDQPVLETP